MSRVDFKNIGKSYGPVSIIEGLDLTIEEGEFFVLLGPSGCGKTTTLRCVAGLEVPSSGEILIGGEAVVDTARSFFVPPSRRDIGMVFQSYALWPHMTVFANVVYPLKARRKSGKAYGERVAEVLAIVGLSGLEKRYPSELSGGQQQRVALARALVNGPGLLLFDEPLSNLDAQLRQRLRDDLRLLHERDRRTALYVTHDQAEALVLADRIAVMKQGKIEQLGTAEDIFRRPVTKFIAEFVGFENFMRAEVLESRGEVALAHIADWNLQLLVRSVRPCSVGMNVVVACRSPALTILDEKNPQHGDSVFNGTLIGTTYMGEHHICTVKVGSQTVRAISRSGRPLADGRSGCPVSIKVSPKELIVIEAAS